MKKTFKYIALTLLLAGFVSCDKFFDDMEGDLTKVTGESLVSSEAGLLSLLANLYAGMPMGAFSQGDMNQLYGNGSHSTPTYGSSTNGFWNYTQVRSVNKFLETLDSAKEKGVIDEVTYNSLRGEGLFIRAYYYFAMVRVYGGVPIVDHSLDEEFGVNDNKGLYIPRSTEKETWDWVIDQFQQAADLLPPSQTQEMRVNKYSALGMKARAALWAASESNYWDRAPINSGYKAVEKGLTLMKKEYAPAYYQLAIDAAAAVINSGAYSLYKSTPSSIDDAINNLTELFQNYKPEEGLLGRSYDTGNKSDGGNGVHGWGPSQCVEGYFNAGAGVYSLTLNLADEYDYYASATDRSHKNGKIQTLATAPADEDAYFNDVEAEMTDAMVANYKKYDRITEPFELKDARFQAWVVYPGATLHGKTINIQGGYVGTDGKVNIYPDNNNAISFWGTDLYPYGGEGENNSAFYKLKTDLNTNTRSFYSFMPRKYLDQNSLNKNTQTPWYDLRYAEVLLIYAEAVAESGKGDATLAAKCLNDVRHRAGFTDDVTLSIDNVIHEWKVEFALENKWSDVLYRRRAFYDKDKTATIEEGTIGHKLTLIPLLDLSGVYSIKYIFLRALPYSATPNFQNYNGTLGFKNESYYGSIPNYDKNHIEKNNE